MTACIGGKEGRKGGREESKGARRTAGREGLVAFMGIHARVQ